MKRLLRKIRKVFLSEIRAVHELKSWPDEFEAICAGTKSHEVRKRDRDFEVGDQLILREYDPLGKTYSGRILYLEIVHITPGGRFGLP